MSAGLPPIDPAALPADVRRGSRAHREAYTAALGFERALVRQLAQTLADTAKPAAGDGEGEGSGSDAATSTYRSMLPDTLADAMTASGGLGLARQLVGPERHR